MLEAVKGETIKAVVYVNPVMKDNKVVDYEYKSNTFEYYFDHSGNSKIPWKDL